MQFLKKVNQPVIKNNLTRTNDYEIKAYKRNFRNRSPIASNSHYAHRSPMKNGQLTLDSGAGEMMYAEPNDINFRQNDETSQVSNNYIIRSPGEGKDDQQHHIEYRYDRSQIDTSQNMGYTNTNRVPQYTIDIKRKRERLSRSPKTINIGESAQEAEYNIRTLRRRSPGINKDKSPKDNPVVDRSFNNVSEAGNIFLDQPMQQGSFIKQNEIIGSPGYLPQNSFEMKTSQELDGNSREIKFVMNPRDLQEPKPGVLQKMSPHVNVDGESDSGSEKNDNVNQIKDLKTQLDNKRKKVKFRDDDGMVERRRKEKNKLNDSMKTREVQDKNITEDEVKRMVRQYVKAYDPRKDQDGNLISNSQTVLRSTKDDLFNDRYKVLQKMNKLSNILLSKTRNTLNETDIYLNRSLGEKTFDKKALNTTVIGGQKLTLKRKPKFLYVSLAMLSSKGLNTEDRTILRSQRTDKGGVVDLAQEKIGKKVKFKIKKVKATGRGHNMINPKYREKAAKIVQAWWKERKEKYKKIFNQIVKIQSVWRGKFTRKYAYDIIFMSYLHQKFLDIMSKTLVNHVRPQVWDDLFSRRKLAKETLSNLLLKKDKRYSALRIRPYFMSWDAISNFLKRRILKSEKLVIKKGDDEQRKKLLKKYLDEWILRTNLVKYIGKAKDAEEKKQKFFGTINMMNGLSNLSKRTVQKNTKEPIKNYLQE